MSYHDSVTAEANAQNRFVQNQPAQDRQSKDPRTWPIVLGAGSGERAWAGRFRRPRSACRGVRYSTMPCRAPASRGLPSTWW